MGPEPGHDGTKPETQRFLTAADYFLQERKFADCCKFAARARETDPNNVAAARILSTAAVLAASRISTTHHDYYAVLNLPYFESDASRISSSFETLSAILDPGTNPYPFAAEAFDLTIQALSVLSNSEEKAKFDGELRRYLSGGCTFWTTCPYCYYAYEYDSVFEDCCVRCANENCGRVLHAVAIGGAPPPGVVEKGEYCCPGFMPFSVRGSNGERIGDNLWLPFAPAHYVGFQEHGYRMKEKISNRDANGGRAENTGGNSVGSNVEGIRMKRKSVPWKSKKLLGRGIRIDGEQAHFVYGVREEGCSNVDRDDDDLLEPRFGGESVGGVEFLEGDDDVFVSLPSQFDFGNGRPMSL